jgi:PhzF family phenazine biosynthesis protein
MVDRRRVSHVSPFFENHRVASVDVFEDPQKRRITDAAMGWMAMGLSIVTVDAFTDARFAGNPAAVCVLPPGKADEDWMQKVAREMNLSETAFLRSRDDKDPRGRGRAGGKSFDLRWFTPIVEVDLCGHATLASAHVLWEEGRVARKEKLRFHTRSGLLTAVRRVEGGQVWIELDFPALLERSFEGSADAVSKALATKPRFVGAFGSDYLVEVESERVLERLSPDFELMKTLPVRGIAVTCPPGASKKARGYDFVSRFFAPSVGVNEDPVTGSAHCFLGPFWGRRLDKKEVFGYQASARGGSVRVRMQGDRVVLGGRAVTVMRGELEQGSATVG